MPKYLSENKTSIDSYEIGDDYIIIQFKNGVIYLYNYENTGIGIVETMKTIAERNSGLNSFIKKIKPAFVENSNF